MDVSKEMVREIILEVLRQTQDSKQSAISEEGDISPLQFKEIGKAEPGATRHEVVIGLSPSFGSTMTKTIIGIPHREVLREMMAGVEEEGLKPRLVKVNRTADVSFIAHEAAKLSGSGIGIGILARGTTVIHQKDLAPLQNLELFSQSPLIELESFRSIGRNAAKYAKGESPSPVPVRSDPMARPRYQGLAALLHNKEVQHVKPDMASTEVAVQL